MFLKKTSKWAEKECMTKIITPDELRFYLLPSANPSPQLRELHDNAFDLWQSVWQKTFQDLGIEKSALDGEFVRQDLIACIAHENVPVALHLYSFYSIDSKAARAHAYFSGNYPEIYFAKLAKANVREVMSMEFMTVHPEWRKGKTNVHMGIVLAGLAFSTMRYFSADAAIAPARRDYKVNELAYAYGSEPVIANVTNHNVACDLVMCRRENVKKHEDPTVQSAVENLWDRREYYPACMPREEAKILPFAPLKKIA
jgi:hypothetical protein